MQTLPQPCQTWLQALVYFQWLQYHVAQIMPGKTPLFLNMDETAIPYSFGGQRGCIIRRRKLPPGHHLRLESTSTQDLRGHISMVTFITHDSAMQPKLPQILLGGPGRFTWKLMKEVGPGVPDNIHLWRLASGWNSQETMCTILNILAATLKEVQASREVILLLDMARCHMHKSVSDVARKHAIRLVYIPAKMTWLVQPCDTHCFARMKSYLRKSWHSAQCKSTSGVVSVQEWLQVIITGMDSVLRRTSWRKAFEDTGILQNQTLLSRFVLAALGLHEPPHVPCTQPTVDMLQVIFSKKYRVHLAWFFLPQRPEVHHAREQVVGTKPFEPGAPAPVEAEGPICSRTRAQTAARLRSQQSGNVTSLLQSTASSSSAPPPAAPLRPVDAKAGPPLPRVLPWTLRERASRPDRRTGSSEQIPRSSPQRKRRRE